MAGRYLDLASADSKLNVLSRTRFMQEHHICKHNYFRLWLHNRIYCSHHYNLSQVLDQPRLIRISIRNGTCKLGPCRNTTSSYAIIQHLYRNLNNCSYHYNLSQVLIQPRLTHFFSEEERERANIITSVMSNFLLPLAFSSVETFVELHQFLVPQHFSVK